MVAEKTFRQDLLYRINTVEIRLPSLRERTGDVPLLAEHFLGLYRRKYQKPAKRLGEDTIRKLEGYRWPGNVRELQHAIERAVILSEEPVLRPSDFLLAEPEICETDRALDGVNLEEAEKILIRRTLSRVGGNISRAAKELGLSRSALYRRLEKHGL
jgi:transcriptional regulator with PAS, ATPase and Fis domain